MIWFTMYNADIRLAKHGTEDSNGMFILFLLHSSESNTALLQL